MNITGAARSKIEEIGPILLSMSDSQIKVDVRNASSDLRRNVLHLATSGRFEAFYAPFDWVNDKAEVVIVGVVPGLQQAAESLLALRSALASGKSPEDAARAVKDAASFKGAMRTLGARLMDHFELHRLFGLPTTRDLFGAAAGRAHYTSAIRYPVTKDGRNYSGDVHLMERPMLRSIVDAHLPRELGSLPAAWIVPFGPTAHRVIDAMAARGAVNPDRVLGGILHPGGQQWNRYNVQLGLVGEAAANEVPGGPDVLRRSAELRAKVAGLLQRRSA
jgi:hypothetical protein